MSECGVLLTTPAAPTPSPSPLPSCDDIECQNGGTCQDAQSPGGQMTYHCDCPLHYQGELCEQGKGELCEQGND